MRRRKRGHRTTEAVPLPVPPRTCSPQAQLGHLQEASSMSHSVCSRSGRPGHAAAGLGCCIQERLRSMPATSAAENPFRTQPGQLRTACHAGDVAKPDGSCAVTTTLLE